VFGTYAGVANFSGRTRICLGIHESQTLHRITIAFPDQLVNLGGRLILA
jgi:hypothetical protein